jgi:hypothetical protein
MPRGLRAVFGQFERRQAIGVLPGQGLGLSHRWGARLDYTTSDIAPQADGAVPHREFSNVPEADLSGLHAHTGFAAVVTEVDVELGARPDVSGSSHRPRRTRPLARSRGWASGLIRSITAESSRVRSRG